MVGESRRVIVQGVYELFEKERSTEWLDQPRINRMVFIGINIHTLDCTHTIPFFVSFCFRLQSRSRSFTAIFQEILFMRSLLCCVIIHTQFSSDCVCNSERTTERKSVLPEFAKFVL